jgi:alpha-L-fucosidase
MSEMSKCGDGTHDPLRVTRRALLQTLVTSALVGPVFADDAGGKRMDVKPTPQQLAWQEAELTMFLHFGMNTFTDREWGEGTEDPRLFDPSELDARQWAHVAREAGFKYLILTAKHHDGFCLWPSRYTEHSVTNSPWRGGKGDVVRELSNACREAGIKFGFYLSPWDRHEPTYGDSPAYNRHFKDQLSELLTQYGEVAEVWFDGANGEGPNGKRQEYDWPGFYEVIRRHQPHALIAISGPDVRWVGNEDGFAHETEWSVQPANPVYHAGQQGSVWWPAECDVSIRPGWFWHAAEDAKVKTLEQLQDIYFRSVGHNSVLLLNVPPNRRGRIAEPDVQRLHDFQAWLQRTFAADLARGKPASAGSSRPGAGPGRAVDGDPKTFWSPDGHGDGARPVPSPAARVPARPEGAKTAREPWLEIDLGNPTRFDLVMTQEQIAEGQRVEEYRIEALIGPDWKEVARGTTIGHKKLDRLTEVTASRLRLTIPRSRGTPLLRTLALYRMTAGTGLSG